MLKYNFERLFKMKGIARPVNYLMENGFSKDKAYRIVNHKISAFTPEQIEKFCFLFDCTPNDLLVWTPDENKIEENHPLKKLLPTTTIDLREVAKGIPIDKMEDFAKKLEEIKKSYK